MCQPRKRKSDTSNTYDIYYINVINCLTEEICTLIPKFLIAALKIPNVWKEKQIYNLNFNELIYYTGKVAFGFNNSNECKRF